MPTPNSIAALGEEMPTGNAVDADLSLVGVVQPVEDVHERRLPRSILTKRRMDIATAEVEVDVVVGEDAREGLCDPRSSRIGRSRSAIPEDLKRQGWPPLRYCLVRRPEA